MPASKGKLQVQVWQGDSYVPITDAVITITQSPEQTVRTTNRVLAQEMKTDVSGLTTEIELEAPPIENSQNPTDKLPYSFCDIKVDAKGFKTMFVKNCQIYPDRGALQQCNMKKVTARQVEEELIDVLPNTLVGLYPPKIPESPEKPMPKPPSGFVVLPEPVVPQYIVVHAGVPDDVSAPNYTVGYKQYVKNVASCEIFSTWPDNTIRANVLCIISFTLNRIYTEWYRGKGKNFDITNSTAYDHAFTYGRNIYDNISRIVDEVFTTYVKRPNTKQPLLTQYCDGVKVKCPNWLSQWGSKYLGDQGLSTIEILKRYYGYNLNFDVAKKVTGSPISYPGYTLGIGSTGAPVRTVQTYLNRISVAYPAIPKMVVDGIYGQGTANAVRTFQQIFKLYQTGTVNYATWYKISDVYVGVTKIAELRREFNRGITQEQSLFIPPAVYAPNFWWHPTVIYPLDEE